jgi:FkbM family methyltransferase
VGALRSKFDRVIQRFYAGDRSADICVAPESISIDEGPRFVPRMLDAKRPHEEEFRLFSFFRTPGTTVLDVGASWGYSTGSIWGTGCASAIISFEPLSFLEPCLLEIKRLRPSRYDYRMCALGDRDDATLRMVVPVLNDIALVSLASAMPDTHLEGLARHTVDHIERRVRGDPLEQMLICYRHGRLRNYIADLVKPTLKMSELTVPMRTLDSALADGSWDVATDRIVAIKIDAEGFSHEILRGACETLQRHRPLVLAERSADSMRPFMRTLGYLRATYASGRLEPDESSVEAEAQVSSCFFHESMRAAYETCGLLGRGGLE